jgi:formamidopyrimidine-DNA glycosylase
MPELPEVETVRRGLLLSLPGEVISKVEILRPDSIGYPEAKQFARSLPGHSFEDIARRGKYLLISLSKGAGLAVHLRMSGRLLFMKRASPVSKFSRVRLLLASGGELRFEDMRVFGRLWYIPSGSTFESVIPSLAELGVEPLDHLDGRLLMELYRNKTQAIKSALLDQRLIAGIGNIYADESLFRAGIHPQTKAGSIVLSQAERLVREIKLVLSKAIALGGSSVRDYTDSSGVNGNYQNDAGVYGRTGKPCLTCGQPVERIKLAGRSTHFCPKCQSKKQKRSLVTSSR